MILFFKRFERIFIVALAFAVVFAAYGAMRGYRAISSENRQKQLDDYQIKLDEYNDSTQKLRDTIDDSQKQLDDLVQYTEDSIYYNLDPYNEAVSELVFYVDTGYQIAPSPVSYTHLESSSSTTCALWIISPKVNSFGDEVEEMRSSCS